WRSRDYPQSPISNLPFSTPSIRHDLQIARQVYRFARADLDFPAGQFFFQFARQDGHLARDDDAAVGDLVGGTGVLDALGDDRRIELARGPGCQHAHALGVGDEQPAGIARTVNLVGDAEVGDGEVRRYHERRVGRGVVDLVEAGLHLDRLLWVGE